MRTIEQCVRAFSRQTQTKQTSFPNEMTQLMLKCQGACPIIKREKNICNSPKCNPRFYLWSSTLKTFHLDPMNEPGNHFEFFHSARFSKSLTIVQVLEKKYSIMYMISINLQTTSLGNQFWYVINMSASVKIKSLTLSYSVDMYII